MANFDPLQRFETWVFQKVGERRTAKGMVPVYKRLGWNRVEYDGDPNQKIEPVSLPRPENMPSQADVFGGQIVGFELVEGRALDAFAMGEVVDLKNPAV